MTDGRAVQLSVEVGPGQPSGISVRLSDEALPGGRQIDGLSLGAGDALRGQRLFVDAVVRNDSPWTDRVGARLSLTGGEEERDWTKRADLDAEALGRFSFTITFV